MKVVIKYETRSTGVVHWQLKYEDGSGIHLFVCSENGTENNKRKAKKAAEHAQRLTQAAVDRKK